MTAATRNEKHIRSASQVLYLALELGVEEWKLAFITDLEAKPRVRIMPARDLKRLVKEVATANAMVRAPGQHQGAQLLRSRARRILAASPPGDRRDR